MINLDQSIEVLTGGYYEGNSSWNKPRTSIDNCLKIYFITSGELSLKNKNCEYILRTGKLYFINGNKLTYQTCQASFSTFWLHFIPKDIILYMHLLDLPLVQEINPNELLPLNILENIEDLFPSSVFWNDKSLIHILQLQTFLQMILIRSLKQYNINETLKNQTTLRLIPAIHYINEHLDENISLTSLAKICCFSDNYFHYLFSKTFKTTPIAYITLLKMNRALNFLLKSSESIKEIAFRLGYNDDAYFARVFKKYYGITPGAYRKNKGKQLFL